MRQWLINIFISLDRLGSSIVGLDPEETISSAVGKMVERGHKSFWALSRILDLIFLIILQEKDHCWKSIQRKEGLFTENYNGALSPRQVVKYALPLQVFGWFVFFNFDFVVSLFTIWG